MSQPIKKLNLYLDTSVWNFVYADDAPEKREVTKRFFGEVGQGRYRIFISDLVALEISKTGGHKKDQLETLVRTYQPVQLAPNEETEELTAAYLKAKVAPTKSVTDMAHAAYAVAHNLDAIISWNLRHIVRLKTRLAVNGINKLLGYREIEIATPEEVVTYGA